jgi:hypothetical protein
MTGFTIVDRDHWRMVPASSPTVTTVDGWHVTAGLTAVLPSGEHVAGCVWHARHAYLEVPGHGSAERVSFDPDGRTVTVRTFERWQQ